VVEQPQFKIVDQRVELLPGARAETLEPVTLLLNQQAGQNVTIAQAGMSMATLSEAHREGLRPLHGHFTRQDCIAPLLPGASGLQVFTQDWRVSRKVDADLRASSRNTSSRSAARPNLVPGTPGPRRERKGVELPKAKASWQNEQHLRMVKNPQPGRSRRCAKPLA
jgi:23S rRNA pseudouridine2604 synthase